MTLITEYKKSLKTLEAEEPLDIYFFRPLAFIIVKMFYRLPITPNHYSFMTFISGMIASYFFMQGTVNGFKAGAAWFCAVAVLDCCDGMVARLKKNGTEYGRLVDGVVDYLVNIATYIAIALGLQKFSPQLFISPWILVILAGVSKILHSLVYDHYLSEYLSYEKGEAGFSNNELVKLKNKLKMMQVNKTPMKALFLKIYILYTSLQTLDERQVLNYNPKQYCAINIKTLRKWSLIAPSVHIMILILSFLLNIPLLLFIYAIFLGNIWFIIMFFYQRTVNKTLSVNNPSLIKTP